MFKKLIVSALVASSSFSALSQDSSEVLDAVAAIQDQKANETKTYAQETKEGLEKKGEIIGIKKVPVNELFFVQAEHGSYLVSSDGRFVIDGKIKDVWHRKTLATLADLEGIDRVPVSANAKKIEQMMATFTIGKEETPRSGVIFVDPSSEITVTALKKLYSLNEDQRWLVVLMPVVGGANALDRSRRLHCAADRELAKLDLINGTSDSFSDIRQDCGDEKLVAAQFVTNLFGIKSLPYVLREDGLSINGFPQEFESWYAQP